MDYLIAAIGLGILCGGWAMLQRWIARIDPEVGDRPCGGGCSAKRRDVDNADEG